MSRPINVLAVLDHMIDVIGYDLVDERKAVAELIEAAKEVQADAKILGMDIPRLEAALACVGGPA